VMRGVFENRVLSRIFGPRRDEVIQECRKLYRVSQTSLFILKSNKN
jgi:hypothetical protein